MTDFSYKRASLWAAFSAAVTNFAFVAEAARRHGGMQFETLPETFSFMATPEYIAAGIGIPLVAGALFEGTRYASERIGKPSSPRR